MNDCDRVLASIFLSSCGVHQKLCLIILNVLLIKSHIKKLTATLQDKLPKDIFIARTTKIITHEKIPQN